MGALTAEFIKLKSSLSWAVAVLLPVAMVFSGAFNTLVSGKALDDGWHTMWVRSVVFYGMFPLALGIGILASLVWRSEHRGGNWRALMSGPTSSLRIVTAKTATVAALAAVMQAALLLSIVLVGKLAFGLPGWLPGEYLAISLVIVAACVPVAALQSGLSMLMRSFAAPVAVALAGAGAAVVLLLADLGSVAYVVPYALVSRATQLGTGTLADTGAVDLATVAGIVVAAAVLTVALVWLFSSILDRRDARG